jgi:hypothetical protein
MALTDAQLDHLFAQVTGLNGKLLEVNQTVHAVLNDHMDETAENFNFHLYGLVARIQELENGLFLYGCRLNNPVPGLEQYIIKKERAVLRKRQSS